MTDSVTKPKRFVVEITLVVDDIGTQQTFYFSTSSFSTKPTDTPANTYVSGRLENPGSFRRELFSGNSVRGAVRPSWGNITLFNDGALDNWVNYGISGGKVHLRFGDEDAVYPSGYTTIFIAYAQNMLVDFNRIDIRLRDRLLLLDQPLLKTSFLGTGGLEGTGDLVGKLRQRLFLDPSPFPVTLLDYTKQIYHVSESATGGLSSFYKLYEGALEITRGTDYASSADLISTSPTIGTCQFWFGSGGNGPVYVRLGSVPVSDLRCFGSGYKPSGAPFKFGDLAEEAGISGAAALSTQSLSSVLIDDSKTVAEILDDSAITSFSYYGMKRDDVYFDGTFTVPSGSPVKTFDRNSIIDLVREPVNDMGAPVYSLTINAGKTYKSNLVTGATSILKEQLSRDPWWVSYTHSDASVKTANPGAMSVVLDTNCRFIQNTLGRDIFVSNYMSRFGVRREFYSVTVPLTNENITIELNDVVELKLNRFNLTSGKLFRVIVQSIDCKSRKVTYGLWG